MSFDDIFFKIEALSYCNLRNWWLTNSNPVRQRRMNLHEELACKDLIKDFLSNDFQIYFFRIKCGVLISNEFPTLFHFARSVGKSFTFLLFNLLKTWHYKSFHKRESISWLAVQEWQECAVWVLNRSPLAPIWFAENFSPQLPK